MEFRKMVMMTLYARQQKRYRGNIHVLMLISRNIPPSPSPTESKSLFFTSVSLWLSHI